MPTVCVVIPCVPSHVVYLPELLSSIAKNVKQPERIVVALSQTSHDDGNRLHKKLQPIVPVSRLHILATTGFGCQHEAREKY